MKNRLTTRLFISLAIGSLLVGLVLAGTLDPPGPPAPTMVTLQQIYDVAKPVPDTCFDNTGNRFVDCGNGTVKDTTTGLIWLKNANCLGETSWAAASIAAAQLASGQCGLTDGSRAGSWRLPTNAEWNAIIKASCADSFLNVTLPDLTGSACYVTSPWATAPPHLPWSSTTNAAEPYRAGNANLNYGFVELGANKTFNGELWPVRGGP